MAFRKPDEIAELAVESGVKKVHSPLSALIVLGFLGGAFIALGYLLDIRVIGDLPKEWGSLSSLIGASVFPIGLVLVVLAGAELITGNMMSVSMALFSRRISAGALVKNWVIVTLMNLVGALFVAYFFGHVVDVRNCFFRRISRPDPFFRRLSLIRFRQQPFIDLPVCR